MLLHAVCVVLAALVASSSAQYPEKPVGGLPVPYKPTDAYDPSYGYHAGTYDPYDPSYKPDGYDVPEPEYYDHAPDPYDHKPEPDPYDQAPYDAVLPPAGYGHGYGYGYGYGYGHGVLDELWQQVLSRIEQQKAKVASVIEFRDQTLASIDKIASLSTAWCRSKYRSVVSMCFITARRNARIASAVLATAIPSVRLSVRHTPVLCQNDGT